MTKLKQKRLEKRISQEDLSKMTNIKLTTLQKYETRRLTIDNANIDTIIILSKVLECKIYDIIENENTIRGLKSVIRKKQVK